MKEKKESWDNGMTIAKMDGNELPSYRRAIYSGRPKRDKNSAKKDKEEFTKKEERAMIGGMFLAMLPRLLVILAAFAITYLLILFWLG